MDLPHYIDNEELAAPWILVIDSATGEHIPGIVAANATQGWIVYETGQLIGAQYELNLRQVDIRFELSAQTPVGIRAYLEDSAR